MFSNLKSQVFKCYCNSNGLQLKTSVFQTMRNNDIVFSNLKLQAFRFCIEFNINEVLIAMFLFLKSHKKLFKQQITMVEAKSSLFFN